MKLGRIDPFDKKEIVADIGGAQGSSLWSGKSAGQIDLCMVSIL